MAIETREENGLFIFAKAFDAARGDKRRGEYVQKCSELGAVISELHKLQLQKGSYPSGLTTETFYQAAEADSSLLSPYMPVELEKVGDQEKLVARPYRDVEVRQENGKVGYVYREGMDSVCKIACEAAALAREGRLSDLKLIKQSLNTQARPFCNGDFRQGREGYLKESSFSEQPLVFGLLEPYDDERYGAKMSFGAFQQQKDVELTNYLSALVKEARELTEPNWRKGPKLRLVAGPALWYAGILADMKFSGETLPSEDDLRKQVAHVHIFSNSLSRNFEDYLGESIKRTVPSSVGIKGWRKKAERAARIMLVMHELGHLQNTSGEEVVRTLKSSYIPLQELEAEVRGHYNLLSLPPKILPASVAKRAIEASLGWAGHDIGEYYLTGDTAKKGYAEAAQLALLFYAEKGCHKLNMDNLTVSDIDLDEYRRYAPQFAFVLKDSIEHEVNDEGFLARRFSRRINIPLSSVFSPKIDDVPLSAV